MLNPEPETGLVGGYRRYGIGHAFQGGVAPGFIVGRKNAQITSGEGLIIGHIDQAVIAVEIGRKKDDVDSVRRQIFESQAITGLQNRIGRLVLKPVRGNGGIPRLPLAVIFLERRDEIGVAADHEEIGQN